MMAKKLSEISGMPQVDGALSGWQNSLSLVVISETVVNGFPTQTESVINFEGVIQPLDPESVKLKPEGQRSWQWLQIHMTAGSTELKPSDKIRYNGTDYKVMGKKDYGLNGYFEYHAVNEFIEG